MIEGLKDKVVIVTGGAHGIGKAYCLGFGRAGARVVLADIDGEAAAHVASQVIQETGAQALTVAVDVSLTKNPPIRWQLRPCSTSAGSMSWSIMPPFLLPSP